MWNWEWEWEEGRGIGEEGEDERMQEKKDQICFEAIYLVLVFQGKRGRGNIIQVILLR